MLRNYLKLDLLTPNDVGRDRAYAANHGALSRIVAHIRGWLAEHESADSAAALSEALPET
jgi:hypothetical protein